MESYLSPCCGQFTLIEKQGEHISLQCRKCKKVFSTITSARTISSKVSQRTNQLISDNGKNFELIAKRYATDPTCMISDRKCKKCSAFMRYMETPNGYPVYVCMEKRCVEF